MAGLIGGCVTVTLAVLGKLLADEVKSWLPTVSMKIVAIAVWRLPKSDRERYSEEWAADVLSYPGEISRIFRALGVIIAAQRMAVAAAAPREQIIRTLIRTSWTLVWLVETTRAKNLFSTRVRRLRKKPVLDISAPDRKKMRQAIVVLIFWTVTTPLRHFGFIQISNFN